MWIDVKVPYEPGKKLAFAYNRALSETTAPWVLLLDHDISLVNPQWYEVCLQVIERLKDTRVGLITCVTSGKTRAFQQSSFTNTDRMEYHIKKALQVYEQYGNQVIKVNTTITGFFMLVKRAVWEQVKFKDMGHGVNKVDIDFSSRVLRAGYSIYVMKGLYVYHRRQFKDVSIDER